MANSQSMRAFCCAMRLHREIEFAKASIEKFKKFFQENHLNIAQKKFSFEIIIGENLNDRKYIEKISKRELINRTLLDIFQW